MELLKVRLSNNKELSFYDNRWSLREVTLDRDIYYGGHDDIEWIINNLCEIHMQGLDGSVSPDICMIQSLVSNHSCLESMIDSIKEVLIDFKSKLNIEMNKISSKNDLLIYLTDQRYRANIIDNSDFNRLLTYILGKLNLVEEDYRESYTEFMLLNQFNLMYYNFNDSSELSDLIQVTGFYGILKIASKIGLIPSEGKADTLLGELFRASQRVIYRLVNDLETSFSYKDCNFMDACNLCDALTYIQLDDSTKDELCKYIIKFVNTYTGSNYEYNPNVGFQLIDYTGKPWTAAIILSAALYHYMVNHLIDASEEVISALNAKNPDLIKQGDIKFKDNELTKPENKLDFRSELYYVY